MAVAYSSRESVLMTLDAVLSHAPLSDVLREQVVADSLSGSAGAKREWPASVIVHDVSADLARIDVPVLVVAADHDKVEPVALMESNVIGLIPGARLRVIADSGHLIPLERPAELSELIAGFRDATVTER
jgi:pimeloyl-ACP methyl ester carboxylesterase